MTRHLSESADWTYLCQEFDTVYRYGSAGGSKVIRSHRRRVRDLLSSIVDENPEIVEREPQSKPVVDHLARALDLGVYGPMHGFARILTRIAPDLAWEYGYESVPKGLAKRFAYTEFLGPRGPIPTDRLILGAVLFAPNTTYPQHNHQDIEESYVSIAGAWSENDAAVYAPGSLILNRSGEQHRITTGGVDPCLLVYAWIGPADRLTAPGMKFSPGRRTPAGKPSDVNVRS
ncbi:dimethylsulfonioproprionate lyase family protein [Fulvimarina sp. MAC3]|uniref:dimethylsulfonioproprionate lyase family protein n=1 Tax=Fulvimarina sp. MAC3 TaxID=3148887 RepID=UPI0031FD3539